MSAVLKNLIFIVVTFAVCALQGGDEGAAGGGSASAAGECGGSASAVRECRLPVYAGSKSCICVNVPWIDGLSLSYHTLDRCSARDLYKNLSVDTALFKSWVLAQPKKKLLDRICLALDNLFESGFPLRCICFLIEKISGVTPGSRGEEKKPEEIDLESIELARELEIALVDRFFRERRLQKCSSCEKKASTPREKRPFVTAVRPCYHLLCRDCKRGDECPVCFREISSMILWTRLES